MMSASNPKPVEGALDAYLSNLRKLASESEDPELSDYIQEVQRLLQLEREAALSAAPAPDNPNDTMEYWRTRAITAEQKVLEFHEQIVLLGAPARDGVRSQSEEWCAGYEAGVAQEREKHTDPMKWLENAFSTYKVMIRTLYEHRLKKGRDWCEQQSCWPESQYWQGYHNALADQQAKTAPWESSDYVRAAKEQADG